MKASEQLAVEESERAWLDAAIAAWWEEHDPSRDHYEHVDNVRFAIKGDIASEEAYTDACAEGCCGSEDMEFGPSPAGRVYMWGFNYGH